MYKTVLKLGILISVIILLNDLYFCYKQYFLREDVWMQPYFRGWFTFSSAINFIGIFILGYYFKMKGYAKVLNGLIAIAIVTSLGTFHTYQAIGIDKLPGLLDHIVTGGVYVTGFIYAIILIKSNAKERPHLRLLGNLLCIFFPFSATLYILFFVSSSPEFRASINEIWAWSETLGNSLPVLYLLNFISELKEVSTSETQLA